MPSNLSIDHWPGRRVWLVGASSGIGHATAHALHARGAQVVVSARNEAALNTFTAAHPGASSLALDVTNGQAVRAAAEHVLAGGPIDLVMYCAGHYKELRATEYDLAEMLRHNDVNYVGALHLLDALLPAFRARRAGHISLVSSVAGYGGLPKSLAYGPTKAALINLAETLYLDLSSSSIGVSLICPGFVETPLTAQNKFDMPALLSPDQAADHIIKGWERGAFEIHFPKRFTRWMKALRLLPYPAYFAAVRKVTAL
jgi:NAD(P)-dependent dehydrogenase (short-subunit alcohol dehydrogenase family)